MKTSLTIRPIVAADRASWDEMWAGYLTFYKTSLPPEVSDNTFARILSGEVVGLIAENDEGYAVGIAHALVYASTWSLKPSGYLHDLYVRNDARVKGTGRALIQELVERGRREGWRRLYWQTASDNITAQALYDKIATRTGWVRYELDL